MVCIQEKKSVMCFLSSFQTEKNSFSSLTRPLLAAISDIKMLGYSSEKLTFVTSLEWNDAGNLVKLATN